MLLGLRPHTTFTFPVPFCPTCRYTLDVVDLLFTARLLRVLLDCLRWVAPHTHIYLAAFVVVRILRCDGTLPDVYWLVTDYLPTGLPLRVCFFTSSSLRSSTVYAHSWVRFALHPHIRVPVVLPRTRCPDHVRFDYLGYVYFALHTVSSSIYTFYTPLTPLLLRLVAVY